MAQVEPSLPRRDPNGVAYGRLRELLVEARQNAGLTQQVLADQLERPQSFVAKLERGERSLDFVELVVIARILGCDVSKFADAILEALNT